LAEVLTIAPNTLVEAYGELRRVSYVESRPGVWTVAAESVGEVAHERQIVTVFERLRVIVRDPAALGISEDDLWVGLDPEFERIPRENGGIEITARVPTRDAT
jgi:DNA-binding transcriptional regulator YhcF (GntR family)